ncbi:cytidylate kinase [Salinibacter sp. 10B]|uniref:(d)CMP kinase n=1 Tax=Salinibacter sp. 10B TaxID=1923971 RepID=UPI000CF4112E|nr:(d)CMP kinase [Salinibacter sp. 10B]PQJ33449.1 cytidylate kinase [Salinibacter sp. 10B]
MIITIDGPAGSGKSTTAQGVAERLQFVYLDTGAMYRAVALGFLQADADVTVEAAQHVLPSIEVDVRYQADGRMQVVLNEEDVSEKIRTPEVGAVVSQISTLRPVRDRLVREQRRIGFEQEERHGGVILDGRDTGTVVFPEADLKVFMMADVDERARRRYQEYTEEGKDISLEAVRQEIRDRDQRDRNREIAPLRRADDAVSLDTTEKTIDEQIAFVVDRVKAHRKSGT